MPRDCSFFLNGDLGGVAQDGLTPEGITDRYDRQQATSKFFTEMNALSAGEQRSVWQKIQGYKACSGSTLTEQQTTIGRDGRKGTYAPR